MDGDERAAAGVRPAAYLLRGDARALPLADGSVQCVVTSPPYWGLRDYGLPPSVWGGEEHEHEWGAMERGKRADLLPADQTSSAGRLGTTAESNKGALDGGRFCACGAWKGTLGLEPTPELYVAHLVEVFREVRRVLRDDGTCWVNLGDSYANDGKWGGETGGKQAYLPDARRGNGREKRTTGLKPKDLVGIPWRVAFALQADGWWLRSDIIWSKPNPMPESVTDRPTKAHEYLFLLSKAARYYYDAEAIKEPAVYPAGPNAPDKIASPFGQGYTRRAGKNELMADQPGSAARKVVGLNARYDEREAAGIYAHGLRNRRSVWTIATEPYPEAHFATFPEKLVEPCILAGTSERGACPACGAPWTREVERQKPPANVFTKRNAPSDGMVYSGSVHEGEWKGHGQKLQNWLNEHPPQSIGWSTTCAHDADPVPCRVLDPFAGSGTTVAVAERLGRTGIGVELKPEYLALAQRRTIQAALL